MTDRSELHVNLSAIEHNVDVLRRIVGPDCRLCPILKADAYGLGAPSVARHLDAAGVDLLAVYDLHEAASVARAAVRGPILVLRPVREIERIDEAYRLLIQGKLHLTVHDPEHFERLHHLAERFATVVPVHLEVDTGMGRGGCEPAVADKLIRRIIHSRWLHLAGVCSHFANAARPSSRTTRQMQIIDRILRQAEVDLPDDCCVHVAATFGLLRAARFHRTMVRFGLAWAGYGPECMTGGTFREQGRALRPVIRWRSHLIHVKSMSAGSTVGYGSRWTAGRETVVGLLPVGYADGVPTGLGSTDDEPMPAVVGILADGADNAPIGYAPIVGRVNMDQVTVDLTDLARRHDLEPGTTVELISTDPEAVNHLPNLARLAGTIPHEMLCRLHPRIKRTYTAARVVESKFPTFIETAAPR